jgi:hypothetical protein
MHGARKAKGRRRAFALLFALGILVLLSVFALSFANLTRLERLAAANVRAQTQATRLAEAGVSLTCATARTAARSRHWIDPVADFWAVGVEWPDQYVGGDGHRIIYENEAGGTDQFNVVSFDAAAKIDLNLGTPNLKTSLQLLAVNRSPPMMTSAQLDALLAARDLRGGFKSRDEVRQLVGDTVWYGKPENVPPIPGLRDSVTVYSTPRLEGGLGTVSGSLGQLAYGDVPSSPLPLSFVSINAAPEHVLHAVLANIEGHPIEVVGETVAEWLNNPDFPAKRGWLRTGGDFSYDPAKALKLAKEIVACRSKQGAPNGIAYGSQPFAGPFKSWQQFAEFLQSLPDALCTADEKSLILAATHVEARHAGYNPDISRRLGGVLIDRFCLTKFTAPLALGGSGILEVRSRGWSTSRDLDESTTSVTDDQVIIAECDLEQVVRVFVPRHFGSQRELLAMATAAGGLKTTMYQLGPELVPRNGMTDEADPVDGFMRLTTESGNVSDPIGLSTGFREAAGPQGPYSFTRSPTLLLRKKGVFGFEGLNVWRKDWESDNASLTASTVPIGLAKEGSFELWIKVAAELDKATDEALVTLVVDDTASWNGALRTKVLGVIQGNPNAVPPIAPYQFPNMMGVTVKLERFRGRLRLTWLYWGSQQGSISRFALGLSEVQRDISAWKPGEWHHIVCSWQNTDQDWNAAAIGSPKTVGSVPNDGVKLVVDNMPLAPVIDSFDFASLESRGFEGVNYHLGKLASVAQTARVYVGGYTFNPPVPGQPVHSTGSTPSTLRRYTNATIDDLFFYPGAGTAVPRPRDLRFEKNLNLVTGTDFEIQVGPDELGCIVAEVENPAGEASLSIVDGTSVKETKATDQAPGELILDAEDCAPYILNGKVTVRVALSGDGTMSPYLERFTVMTIPRLQVLEETRDPP